MLYSFGALLYQSIKVNSNFGNLSWFNFVVFLLLTRRLKIDYQNVEDFARLLLWTSSSLTNYNCLTNRYQTNVLLAIDTRSQAARYWAAQEPLNNF